MKITLDCTQVLVHITVGSASVPARLWEGHTEDGVPVHAYITRISPQTDAPEIAEKFRRELVETARPSVTMGAIPLRMIL